MKRFNTELFADAFSSCIFSALLTGIVLFLMYKIFQYSKQKIHFPGPKGTWYNGNLTELLADNAHEYWLKWNREHGQIFEIACSPIPTNICSHGIEHFRKLTEKKNEELEDIVEKLEASRGYDSERIKKRLEKIGQHHGYNKSQMTKMLEKLNEADLYAILHYATIFNNVAFCKIIIEDYGCYVNLVGWDGETPLHIAARLTDINKPDQTVSKTYY
ncbi:unnamed protein product [Adineta steineri]|uniref:Uncharacterized protein n=1 Tax=Adineta steineri TaxID=433720 RepID=A0A813PJY6_9BILA|nr:unnamed protein product [Adineta steineri]